MIKVTVGNNMSRQSVIVDEEKTLREVLEENNVDYSHAAPSLDGSTLRPGDLDKTFAEMGITSACYLLTVVKADNAAAIAIMGGACVIKSAHSIAEIKKVQKYRPEALVLYKGEGKDKEPVFAVGVGSGAGKINEFGATFGGQESSDGKATITIMVPDGTKEPADWAQEYIGTAILKLNKVEEKFGEALNSIDTEVAAIRENITVM